MGGLSKRMGSAKQHCPGHRHIRRKDGALTEHLPTGQGARSTERSPGTPLGNK